MTGSHPVGFWILAVCITFEKMVGHPRSIFPFFRGIISECCP